MRLILLILLIVLDATDQIFSSLGFPSCHLTLVFHLPFWLFFLGLLWSLLRLWLFLQCLCPWDLGLGCPLMFFFYIPFGTSHPLNRGFSYGIIDHATSLHTRLIYPNARWNPGLSAALFLQKHSPYYARVISQVRSLIIIIIGVWLLYNVLLASTVHRGE